MFYVPTLNMHIDPVVQQTHRGGQAAWIRIDNHAFNVASKNIVASCLTMDGPTALEVPKPMNGINISPFPTINQELNSPYTATMVPFPEG